MGKLSQGVAVSRGGCDWVASASMEVCSNIVSGRTGGRQVVKGRGWIWFWSCTDRDDLR